MVGVSSLLNAQALEAAVEDLIDHEVAMLDALQSVGHMLSLESSLSYAEAGY